MVRRSNPGPREYDLPSKSFRPKAEAIERYQLRSEKGQPRGYASLGSDGIVPASQLPDSETSTTVAGVALNGGMLMQWIDENTLRLRPNGPDGSARVPVVNAGGTWLSVELESALTWDKRATGAGGIQTGSSLSADTLYEIRLVTKAGGLVPALIGTPNGQTLALPPDYTHFSQVLGPAAVDDSEELREFHQAGDYFWYDYPDEGAGLAGFPLIEPRGLATAVTAIDCSAFIPAAAVEGKFFGFAANLGVTLRSAEITDVNGTKRMLFRCADTNDAYETVMSGPFDCPFFGSPESDMSYHWTPSAATGTGAGLEVNVIGFRLDFSQIQAVTLVGTGGGSSYEDPLTTKGDLLARTVAATIRLGVGTDGQVLTADSAAAEGVAWDTPTAGVADGDKGDITVSGSGATWTIDNDAVTYAKMQNVSAASRVLGRGSASGAGDVQELTLGGTLSMSGTVLSSSADGGNATTLDGVDSTQFLRSDLSDTYDGATLTIDGSTVYFQVDATLEVDGTLDLGGAVSTTLPSANITGAGAGSGLDADMLDGLEATQFLRLDVDDTFTGDELTIDSAATLAVLGTLYANDNINFADAAILELPNTGISGAGSGSGLDADKLDNLDSAAFAQLAVANTFTEEPQTVSKSQNAATEVIVENVNASGSAYAEFAARNAAAVASSIRLIALGTGFTTVGQFVADRGCVVADTDLSAGLVLMARHATTGDIRFVTGGHTTVRTTIEAAGNVLLAADPTVALGAATKQYVDALGFTAETYFGGNMLMNWSAGAGCWTGETATAFQWWTIAAQLTVTVVSCITEGIPDTYGKYAFKIVTSGSGSGAKFSQRINVADHSILDNVTSPTVKISAGWRVYQASGGSTITGSLIDSAATSYGTATTTTNASWELLKVQNVSVASAVTYIDYNIEVGTNSKTYYMQPAGFNRGAVLLPYQDNPQMVVHKRTNAVVSRDPANTNWNTASYAAATHPLCFMIGGTMMVTCVTSINGAIGYLRPSFTAQAQETSTAVTRSFVISSTTAFGRFEEFCNASQQMDDSAGNATNVSLIETSVSHYWRGTW